jgi:hypothetical protein
VKFCLCWRSSGAEQLPCKQWVGGSNPPASASNFGEFANHMPAGSGRYPSGQRGQTVNLLAYAFGGSNPPLPTTRVAAGGNSSAVERQPSKLGVAGSNPVSRSRVFASRAPSVVGSRGAPRVPRRALSIWGIGGHVGAPNMMVSHAHVAQSAERVLGKDEVSGSIPDMGSTLSGAAVDGGQ